MKKQGDLDLPAVTRDEEGRLIYVERGRSGRRYTRPLRKKSSKSKLKAIVRAQRP